VATEPVLRTQARDQHVADALTEIRVAGVVEPRLGVQRLDEAFAAARGSCDRRNPTGPVSHRAASSRFAAFRPCPLIAGRPSIPRTSRRALVGCTISLEADPAKAQRAVSDGLPYPASCRAPDRDAPAPCVTLPSGRCLRRVLVHMDTVVAVVERLHPIIVRLQVPGTTLRECARPRSPAPRPRPARSNRDSRRCSGHHRRMTELLVGRRQLVRSRRIRLLQSANSRAVLSTNDGSGTQPRSSCSAVKGSGVAPRSATLDRELGRVLAARSMKVWRTSSDCVSAPSAASCPCFRGAHDDLEAPVGFQSATARRREIRSRSAWSSPHSCPCWSAMLR
jgi:hypothetical protein